VGPDGALDIDVLFQHAQADGPSSFEHDSKFVEAGSLQALENENARLTELVARMESERATRASFDDLEPSFQELEASGQTPALVKEKKLARLLRLAKEQMLQVEELQTAYNSKCQEFKMSDEMLSELQLGKARLVDDNILISRRCQRLSSAMSTLKTEYEQQRLKTEAVCALGKALALSLLTPPDGWTGTEEEQEASGFIGGMYLDFFTAYAKATKASTRIQSMLRGAKTRRTHSFKSKPAQPGQPTPPVTVSQSEDTFLPHIIPLVSVMLQVESDVPTVAQIQHTLQLAKTETAVALRDAVASDLGAAASFLEQQRASIMDAVTRVTRKPQNHVGTQAKARVRNSTCQWADDAPDETSKGKKK